MRVVVMCLSIVIFSILITCIGIGVGGLFTCMDNPNDWFKFSTTIFVVMSLLLSLGAYYLLNIIMNWYDKQEEINRLYKLADRVDRESAIPVVGVEMPSNRLTYRDLEDLQIKMFLKHLKEAMVSIPHEYDILAMAIKDKGIPESMYLNGNPKSEPNDKNFLGMDIVFTNLMPKNQVMFSWHTETLNIRAHKNLFYEQ